MNISFPLILDGAMGTQLQKKGLPQGVCPEKWILENPDAVREIQSTYIASGSNVIYAPTFGANSASLEKHGIFNKVGEYNAALAGLSLETAAGKALVAGDISSTGGMLYPMGNMSFEDFYEIYLEQARALENAGVDLFVIETMTSIPEARAAVLAVKSVSEKPIFVSFSCDESGRTMMGSDVCAALEIMQGMGVDAFGLNCSVGPEELLEHIERLYELADIPIIAKPNAGLPCEKDGKTEFSVDAEGFAALVPELVNAGASIIGGCCGTDESYIAGIKKALESVTVKSPAPQYSEYLPCASEKDAFLLPPDAACETVLACDDELEDNIYELEEDELFAIEIVTIEDVAVFSDVQYCIKNPLCIICDDAALLEKALRAYQGRALYDGALSDDELMPLVAKYGLII